MLCFVLCCVVVWLLRHVCAAQVLSGVRTSSVRSSPPISAKPPKARQYLAPRFHQRHSSTHSTPLQPSLSEFSLVGAGIEGKVVASTSPLEGELIAARQAFPLRVIHRFLCFCSQCLFRRIIAANCQPKARVGDRKGEERLVSPHDFRSKRSNY